MPQVIAPPLGGLDLGFRAADGSPTRIRLLCGVGDPNNGTVDGLSSAAVGSIFLRNDGGANSVLYVKEAIGTPGSSGTWTPK